MLEGVNQAARAPAGLPLFSARKVPGLFPTTATGRQAADEACHLGLIRRDSSADSEVFVTISSIDEAFSQTVYTLFSYADADIVHGAKFVDLFGTTADGVVTVDLARLSEIVRVPLP